MSLMSLIAAKVPREALEVTIISLGETPVPTAERPTVPASDVHRPATSPAGAGRNGPSPAGVLLPRPPKGAPPVYNPVGYRSVGYQVLVCRPNPSDLDCVWMKCSFFAQALTSPSCYDIAVYLRVVCQSDPRGGTLTHASPAHTHTCASPNGAHPPSPVEELRLPTNPKLACRARELVLDLFRSAAVERAPRRS